MISTITAMLLISYFIIYKVSVPPLRNNLHSPDEEGFNYEEIHFESKDGANLHGWFIYRPEVLELNKFNIIVFAHGWGRNASYMFDYAKVFYEDNNVLLLFDMKNHGESDRKGLSTIVQFKNDIISAVDFCIQKLPDFCGKVFVFGHSMGGSGTIVALAETPMIHAGITFAAFADPYLTLKQALIWSKIPANPTADLLMRFFLRYNRMKVFDASPLIRIKDLSKPLLLIHGEKDDVIMPTDFETLKNEANPNNVTAMLIKDIDHYNLLHSKNIIQLLRNFIKDNS